MRMTEGDVPVKKTLTHILLLALALALSLGTCAFAEEAEETAAVSTPAYIFWQDTDWWPAAWLEEDDYWTPTPAMVTGEGWYTVKLDAHMPSWFYSGGNSNIGAQKLAIIIKDGQDLFPGLYMQITDIRVDGVSYPCGAVTYGQTGYDNINDQEGGKVYWDANDTYGLIWDQWMIDNGGTVGTGATWDSTAEAQKFDVFDVSVLNNPSSIEIDFFLSAQQDVQPAGGPALRVLSEGPVLHGEVVKLSAASDIQLDAWMYFADGAWWPQRQQIDQTGNGVNYTDAVVTGQGAYTVGLDFKSQGWHANGANGINSAYLVIEGGESVMPGSYVQITDIRVDGKSVAFNNNLTVPFTWDTADQTDTAVPLFLAWMNDQDHNTWNRREWGEDATCKVLDPSVVVNAGGIEVDFIVTEEAGAKPEIPVLSYDYKWFSNNTMGVAGYSLRDLGVTDKWYNIVPVDLTADGIYKIPMVASNMVVIGNAIVTVEGDNVTVTYETQHASPGNLTVSSECVKWFDEIADVTADFCADPQSDIAFGEAVSKADLGKVGYLFICNRVTYCQPIADNGIYLPSYNHNHQTWEAYRAGLDAMVEALTAEEVTPAE